MYGWMEITREPGKKANVRVRHLAQDWVVQGMPDAAPDRFDSAGALARIKAAFPAEQCAGLRDVVLARAERACKRFKDPADADFALGLVIEYFKQHPDDHEPLLKAIDGEIARQFGPLPKATRKDIVEAIQVLKDVAFLLPPRTRPGVIAGVCAAIKRNLYALANKSGHYDELVLFGVPASTFKLNDEMEAIRRVVEGTSRHDRRWDSVFSVALGALIHCEADAIEPLGRWLRALHSNPKTLAFFPLIAKAMIENLEQAPGFSLLLARFEAIRSMAEAPDQDRESVVASTMARAITRSKLETNELVANTIAAIDEHREMGARRPSSEAALRLRRREERKGRKAKFSSSLALLRDQAASLSMPLREELQGWALPKLVEWIGGPLTGPQRGRLVRDKLIAKDSGMAEPAREIRIEDDGSTERPHGPDVQAAVAPVLTAQEVDEVATAGLHAAIALFQAELAGAIAYGKEVGVAGPALEACAACSGDLEAAAHDLALPSKASAPDHGEAVQALLTRCECALDELRAQVKVEEQQSQTRARFAAQLQLALAREPLQRLRREGGVIDCPLQPSDWAWVNATYHNRIVRNARHLLDNGQVAPLKPNEQLRLYVTLSSRSGYLGDISVHLWTGDAAALAQAPDQPGQPWDPFPKAGDGGGWYDTYVTCCVLHVDRAAPARPPVSGKPVKQVKVVVKK